MNRLFGTLGLVLALGSTFALGACSGLTSSQSVYGMEGQYTVAAREEARLTQQGIVRGGMATEMKRLDNVAYNALLPLRSAARAGKPMNGTDVASAQAALSALMTYVEQHGGKIAQ